MSAESYFISTPYIDAYQHDWEASQNRPKLNYDNFALAMERQASEWGEMGVGRTYLRGYDAAMFDGRYVLAFGVLGEKRYVAVPKQGAWGYDIVAVGDWQWPQEWDVT